MTTQTQTLTTFLLARFDEAERMVALGMDPAEFMGKRMIDGREFVRADFEAKRRIVELAVGFTESSLPHAGDRILQVLALPYASHPEFRAEWAL